MLATASVIAQRASDSTEERDIRRVERLAGDNRGRIEEAEKRMGEFKVNLESRLTRLETKMDGIERVLWLVVGGLVALV